MEIIEERTIGPSLGAENIAKGFNSVIWGFLVIVAFMCVYYAVFGMFSSVALAVNLLLLVAVLSMLQATLTLPGMAAMALALGMAIDSNVLINERVREELRLGASPQAAIHTGYDPDCGCGPVGFWLWSCARLCGGALFRHFDQHVLCGVFLARFGQSLVWPPEKTQVGVYRHSLAT
jgi:hypothetical protein